MELVLPNFKSIELNAPAHFHLPRVLQSGLINYEPITLSSALALAQVSDDVFIDIGANIGVYSLTVSALRKFCYAFEPFKQASDVLKEAADKYDLPIKVYEAAVSNEEGSAIFYLSDKSDMSNSLNSAYRKHIDQIEVKVTTIDDICERVKPGIIKIDAETAERDILEGARNTIARDRPYILLEVLRKDLEIYALEYFSKLDYSIYKLGEDSFRSKLVDIASDDKEDLRNWLVSPKPLDDNFYQRVNHWLEVLEKVSEIQRQ